MSASAKGYAVLKDGEISVRTVSPTPIAAMVNWLIVDARILIIHGTPDEEVRRVWEKYRGDADVVPVVMQVAS